MEFVLFLCAALSALTGAITGVRVPDVAVRMERVSQRGVAALTQPARTVAAIVQAQSLPSLTASRVLAATRPLAIHAPVPIFAGRRRE